MHVQQSATRGPASGHTVLVVEDDPSIRTLLTSALGAAGYTVTGAATGQEAMALAGGRHPDLIVLDVVLPDTDGYRITRDLRARGVYTPVLFLTARTEVEDRIIGLSSGGDDYVTKPFHVQEVLLRVRAILRRTGLPPAPADARPVLAYADLTLDEDAHEVHRAGRLVRLSPTEFRLLACLMSHPERVRGKGEILQEVWRYGFSGDTRIVDTYIKNLRRKVDRDPPALLHTVRGVGYCLRLPRHAPGAR
ncbi:MULTISPECIES: response regulator transcription factor [Streptomyces]|uniref:DNA-binding response regulator n=1 Tax=Streptomyces gougerotii TaxID=53448 RepID=A0A8H9HDB9_9ACTN|nr:MULTISPECIES: response regulator transcription factor [Streptomyces]NEE42519.1 response regulator transcription factor [Streptomyces sp. SID7982]MBL3807022.1 response regulator transcription factor [Streptomyces sp. BRB081]PJM85231.1 DNA-binding response regulator [Streptomyces sp. TSRI0384-2]GFH66048.1 DNA-binding response regulator [Streptomyces rutgersensis]GFH75737.1 DNA-binding response regulator [Streptomyces gougerotii]